MRVTILGSSGQIGAYLTTYLREKGHVVKEFDKNNGDHQDLTKIPNPLLGMLYTILTLYLFLPLMWVVLIILRSISIPLGLLITMNV